EARGAPPIPRAAAAPPRPPARDGVPRPPRRLDAFRASRAPDDGALARVGLRRGRGAPVALRGGGPRGRAARGRRAPRGERRARGRGLPRLRGDAPRRVL